MQTVKQIIETLTANEYEALMLVVNEYSPTDIACYEKRLTPSQKGTFGSLVKKGLIFDSYAGWEHDDPDHQEGNWFPTDETTEAFGLPLHRGY